MLRLLVKPQKICCGSVLALLLSHLKIVIVLFSLPPAPKIHLQFRDMKRRIRTYPLPYPVALRPLRLALLPPLLHPLLRELLSQHPLMLLCRLIALPSLPVNRAINLCFRPSSTG
jgi:hypothetical protein